MEGTWENTWNLVIAKKKIQLLRKMRNNINMKIT